MVTTTSKEEHLADTDIEISILYVVVEFNTHENRAITAQEERKSGGNVYSGR